MKKALKTILVFSIAVFGVGFLLVPSVLAQNNNLVVQFDPDSLFVETNFLPGQNATGTARVTNNSGQPQRIAAEAINYPGFPNPNNVPVHDLSRALSIIIREEVGSDLYGGSSPTGEKTLFNFYEDGETYLNSDISAGGTKTYEFEIIFPAGKGNEWQADTTTFDILIGFQGVGGLVSPGGGIGLPPGLTIQYEGEFYIGTTTVTITWTTSYLSTSQVIYDILPGQFDLNEGLPKYGYAYSKEGDDSGFEKVTSHSVTITGLSSGTTYYYRTVSHASLAISREHSFTTLGVREEVLSPEEVPEGEEEEVVPTKEEPLPEEVVLAPMGEETQGPSKKEAVEGEKGIVSPEEIQGPALVKEEESLGEIFVTEGLLAAIGAMPFNLKLILSIAGLVIIGLIILWLIRKRKTKS